MLPRQMFLKPKAETHTNWLQHQEAAQVCEVEHQRGWARWRSTEPLPTEQKRLNQKTSDDTTNVLICRIGVRSISLVAHVNPPQALEQAKHATLEGGSPIEKMILAATESLTCHEQWSATYQANCKLLATPVCTILWLSVQTTFHNLAKAKKCPVARDFVKMGNFLRRVKSWDANLEESIIVGLRVHKTDCKDLQRVLGVKSPKQPIGSQDGCRSKSEAISLDAQANAETERGLGDHIFFSRSGSGFHFLSLQVTWNLTSKLIPPLNLKVLQVPWSNLYKFTTGGSAGKKSMTYILLHPLMGLVKDGVQYDSTK